MRDINVDHELSRYEISNGEIMDSVNKRIERRIKESEVIAKATQYLTSSLDCSHYKTIENILRERFGEKEKYTITSEQKGLDYIFTIKNIAKNHQGRQIWIRKNYDNTYDVVVESSSQKYHGDSLTERQFVAELDTFDKFFSTGTVLEKSKLQKKIADYSNLIHSN